MKKWDYKVKVVGIPEDRVEDVLGKIEDLTRAEGLRVEFDLGEQSDDD